MAIIAVILSISFECYFIHWLGSWSLTWFHYEAVFILGFLLLWYFTYLFLAWNYILLLASTGVYYLFFLWFRLVSRLWTQHFFSIIFLHFNWLSYTFCFNRHWNTRDTTFIKLLFTLLFWLGLETIKTHFLSRYQSLRNLYYTAFFTGRNLLFLF